MGLAGWVPRPARGKSASQAGQGRAGWEPEYLGPRIFGAANECAWRPWNVGEERRAEVNLVRSYFSSWKFYNCGDQRIIGTGRRLGERAIFSSQRRGKIYTNLWRFRGGSRREAGGTEKGLVPNNS